MMRSRTSAVHQRNLKHRHIGLWVHQSQRYPGAMIESAIRNPLDSNTGGLEQARGLLSTVRITGSRIDEIEQRLRKPSKIVNSDRVGSE